MKNAVYGKTMRSLRNRVDLRLINNEKDYLKQKLKPSYIAKKIPQNDLIVIHKIKTII